MTILLLFILSLEQCYELTRVGLSHLGRHCLNLASLRLRMCLFEGDFSALSSLPKLKSLEVVPSTGHEDVEELKRMNPNVLVKKWYGD